MKTRRKTPVQPPGRKLSSADKRSLLLRTLVAASLVIGTLAFAGRAEATVSAPSCGGGDGNLCSSYEFCLLGFCVSGKRYYDHDNPRPETPTYFCTSKTCQ